MFAKLFRYDFKKSIKFFAVIYCILLVASIAARLLADCSNTNFTYILSQIFQGSIWAGVATLFINNLLRLWASFRRDIYGDRGFLFCTLPINTKSLYYTKFLTALTILILNILISSGAILLAYGDAISSFQSATKEILLIISLLALQIFSLYIIGTIGIILENKSLTKKTKKNHVLISLILYILSQIYLLLAIPIVSIFRPEIYEVLQSTGTILDFELLKTIILVLISLQIIQILLLALVSASKIKSSINLK